MDGVQTGPAGAGMVLESLGGQWFRLRPGPGFSALAPGASVEFDYLHLGVLNNTDMAPRGPYLAADSDPESGTAIADYRYEAMAQPVLAPHVLYARNAATVDLPVAALPPVFPTPLRVDALPGSLKPRRRARCWAATWPPPARLRPCCAYASARSPAWPRPRLTS